MVINKSSMEVLANGNSASEFSSDSDFKKPPPSSSNHGNGSSEQKDQNGSGSSSSKPKDSHHTSSSSSRDKDRPSGSSSAHKSSSSSSSSKVSGSSSSSDVKHSSSSSKHPSSSSSSSSSKPRDGSTAPSSKDSSSSGARSSSSKESVSGSSSGSKHRDGTSSSSSSRPKDGTSSSSSSSRPKDPTSQSSSSSKSALGTPSSSTKPEGGSSSSSSKPKEGSSGSSRPKESSSKPRITESSFLTDNIVAGSQPRPSSKSSSGDKKPSVKTEAVAVKAEVVSPVKAESAGVKVEATPTKSNKGASDEEDDIPLFNRIGSASTTPAAVKVKEESSDDETPLMARAMNQKCESEPRVKVKTKRKHEIDSGDDSDVPLAKRVEKAKKSKSSDDARRHSTGDLKRKRTDDDFSPAAKNSKKKTAKKGKVEEEASPQKGKKKKKEAEEDDTKWKWWEEGERDETVKWHTLEHKGPVFAPPYEPLPSSVKFYYDGKHMKLSVDTEEVAGFYGKMLEHEYTTRELFNKNFFKDWRKVMTNAEKEAITDLKKCNFKEFCEYYKKKSEERKSMTKDEKNKIKAENEALIKEYGVCIIDGHKQKIGNFRIEPPGLFRGRGDHPKQGMHKKRISAQDILINCSKGSKIPVAPDGKKWKEVRHDNTVTWLCSWNENIQGATKYIMLNAASKLKGEKDWKKYETARRLHRCVDKIRRQYNEDLKSKEMKLRQRAVALYFIDKLALRAGNEKDEDTADTVGCCSLRYEHIKLHDMLDEKECVVEFDFLGKDSIRYYNAVPVEKRVYKNLQLFMENKSSGDDLFDRLNTGILNKHLQELMDGLSAKVFRTYNASRTLQEQLDLLTEANDTVNAKMLSYNRANRAVAILCNHQRAAPKNFQNQMENLQGKMATNGLNSAGHVFDDAEEWVEETDPFLRLCDRVIDAKKDLIKAAKKEVKDAKSDYKATKSQNAKNMIDKKQKTVDRLEEQLSKLEMTATDKDENKEIALGTSKLNYLDPRISVAWCKKWEVPIEKVFNKTQREKFAWAIDMADEDYSFI